MPGVDYGRRLEMTLIGDAVTFSDALTAFAERFDVAKAVGFAYTPSAAPWFRREGDGWRARTGAIPASAFELRAFTPTAELRWWRTTGFDEGRAIVLTEVADNADPLPDGLFRLDSNDRSMLLWGATTGESDNGWTNLAEGRIGDVVWVPVDDAANGARVRLHLVDYVSRDVHGNITVAEQRLAGLRIVSRQPGSEEQ